MDLTVAEGPGLHGSPRDDRSVSSAAMRDLVGAAPLGIGLFDRELRYVLVNETLAGINGVSAAGHHGRRVAEVLPDLAEQVDPVMRNVLRTGVPAVDMIVSGRTHAHGGVPREFLASFYRVGTGDEVGVGVVVTDVTEQRQAERRLRQLIDGLFTFVGLCDPDGTLTEANRTALDAAGLEPSDVLGRPFWEAYWWSHDEAVQAQLREAIARAREGEASRYDVDVRVKGGELITIDFQLVPIVEDGVVTAMVPSGMDIGERRRNERQLEATAALARGLSAAGSTESVIETILRHGTAALDADFANVALVDAGSVQQFHPPSLPKALVARYATLALDAPVPVCDAIRRNEVIVVGSGADHGGRYDAVYRDLVANGFASAAGSPLVSGGRVLGALGAAWRPGRTVAPADEARLAIVSKLCAQAFGRTIRAERQEEFIISLQRQMLPDPPKLAELDIAVRYEPATEIGFGGDWYDIIELDPHRVAFIVGDIAGHGIDAAAEMTVVRSTINALIRLGVPLGELLGRAHAAMADGGNRFIGTLAIAVVDTDARSCRYLTAGHPPPALRHADGVAVVLDPLPNPPLGIGRHGTSAVGTVVFDPGGTLVLYSDGLIERRREHIDHGLERLQAALAGCDTDAAATLECLIGRLRPPEATWPDDVALIVIHRVR